MKPQTKRILITLCSALIMMIFYYIAGATVVVGRLYEPNASLVQGSCIWMSVTIGIVFCLLQNKSLNILIITKKSIASIKSLIYFIPLIIIALLGIVGGINFSYGIKTIVGKFYLTLAVGFSEEIYCRGIIFQTWKQKGLIQAVLISSIIFALCHILNICGGAGIFETVLQIFFAFFYGTVMSMIFIKTNNLWPCILLHFLHDFCSFIGKPVSLKIEIVLGVIQTVILVAYGIYLFKEFVLNKEFQKISYGKL